MRELSLFSGAGGGLLGSLILGWEPVQFVEHDAYCQRVLAARFPGVPIHSDVRDFHPKPGCCDVITAGFPCQPFSQAGKRAGHADDRNMWPEVVRVLRESESPLFFGENVPGLLSAGNGAGPDVDNGPDALGRYFGVVLRDLAEAGFDAEWCVLGADDVGAPHRRKRLWILAYCDSFQWRPSGMGSVPGADGRDDAGRCCALRTEATVAYRDSHDQGAEPGAVGGAARAAGRDAAFDLPAGRGEVPGGAEDVDDAPHPDGWRSGGQEHARWWPSQVGGPNLSPWHVDPADVGDAERIGGAARNGEPREASEPELPTERGDYADWLAEPYVGRVAHGVAKRVDRLRALGNGQVPATMAVAFAILARRAGLDMTPLTPWLDVREEGA